MFVETEKRPAGDFPLSRENDSKTLDVVSKALLMAADLIQHRGLPCQAFDLEGRGCVIVTLGEVSDFYITEAAMDRLHKNGIDFIARWSDKAGSEGRAHEVVAKLRAVALGL